MMPGMDGLEAVRIIRNEIDSEYAKNIPIIALTANAITGTEEVFLKNGFQAFLTKPIDIIRLNEAIKRWVRDKDLEKELRTKGELTEQAPLETNKLYDDPRISAFEENPPQGFDYKKALERFGDIDAYADSLKSYMIHTPPLLEELKASAQAEMADQYRITVHGLKSSSYAIGAEHTGKLAEELEKKAASKDLDFMVNHTAALTGSASELIAWLSKILERIQSGEEKPLKHEPDSAVLMRIMEAAEAYDQEGLDNALADLEKFNYENGAQLGGWIKEQADSSGFEAIAEKLLQEGFVKEK
jgi:CheY-like chemotaxis protein